MYVEKKQSGSITRLRDKSYWNQSLDWYFCAISFLNESYSFHLGHQLNENKRFHFLPRRMTTQGWKKWWRTAKAHRQEKPATVVQCWFLLPRGISLLLLYTNTNEADQCLILLNIEKYLFKIFCHSEKTVDWHLLSLCSVSDVTVEKVCFMCQDSVPFLEQSRCAGLQSPLYFYYDVFLCYISLFRCTRNIYFEK